MNIASIFLATMLFLSSPASDDKSISHTILAQDRGHVVLLSDKGEIQWEVPCPMNSHDLSVLPSGNFLLHTGGAKIVEMTRDKKIVWEWESKPVAPYSGRVEIHGFQRLKNGDTMIAETGNKRIIEVDKNGVIKKEVPLTVERPDSHRDTRRVRKLDNGNYLVAHEGLGCVREYDSTGKIVWEYKLDLNNQPEVGGHDGHGTSVFNALRLRDGKTLIGGGNNNRVFEVDKNGKITWSVERDELKDLDGKPIHLCWVTTIQRLPNGNTVIGNTHAGPENPQLIEVTKEKKVVWTFKNWTAVGNDLCCSWLMDVKGRVIR
jgi:hypothetical protein